MLSDIPLLLNIADTATKALTVDQVARLGQLADEPGQIAGPPQVP